MDIFRTGLHGGHDGGKYPRVHGTRGHPASCSGSVAGALGVWIGTNRFRTWENQHYQSATIPLPVATDDSGQLMAQAVALMRRIFRPNCRYWKSGVMLLDLRSASTVQYTLF